MKPSTMLKMTLMAVFDCLFFWISWIGAIYIFGYFFKVDYALINTTNQNILFLMIMSVVLFTTLGIYNNLWQHFWIGSIIRLAFAVLISTLGVYVSFRIKLGKWSNPSLPVMAFYIFFSLSFVVRAYKHVLQAFIQKFHHLLNKKNISLPNEAVRTLLLGAGESGASFLVHSSQQGSRSRNILGILDNDNRKHGYNLHGIDILGDDSRIPELCKKLDIEEIIIAIPSIKNEDLQRIVKMTPINRCKVRIVTGLSSDVSDAKLRDINIDDLLGRPQTILDTQGISQWLSGKTILITGGGGSIGSEICRQLVNFEIDKIIIYDISENNAYNLQGEMNAVFGQKIKSKFFIHIGSVLDQYRLEEVFDMYKPSIVFHAAAYKHVPLMEECPRIALENNVLGTYYTAICSNKYHVEQFVLISTDKAVNPTNVMGASKRLAEMLILSFNEEKKTKYFCVRFGNVLESNGSVVPLFKRQIEAGGPVTVTHPNIIRYFMTIPEAAQLVIEASVMGNGGEIFILDMGNPVKILDLAENLIRMSGLIPEVDIKIEFIGLRPGEKLYEELLLDEEGLNQTKNNQIYVVSPKCLTKNEGCEIITSVQAAFKKNEELKVLLKRFIPEYQCVLEPKKNPDV